MAWSAGSEDDQLLDPRECAGLYGSLAKVLLGHFLDVFDALIGRLRVRVEISRFSARAFGKGGYAATTGPCTLWVLLPFLFRTLGHGLPGSRVWPCANAQAISMGLLPKKKNF